MITYKRGGFHFIASSLTSASSPKRSTTLGLERFIAQIKR